MSKFRFGTLANIVTDNPLIRSLQEQRELRQWQRTQKRRRAKAKANRDRLIAQLARMTPEERQRNIGLRLRAQVINLNRVLTEG